ncbi:MAG: hypothetical protein Q8873_05645 [Bacillota bacterium]|nr:hypothetical protein [Bacillota bacterium]
METLKVIEQRRILGRKKWIIIGAVLVFIIVSVGAMKIFSVEESEHNFVAEEYVKAYIDDNIEDQYRVMDVSTIYPRSSETDDIISSYNARPLFFQKYTHSLQQIKHIDETTLNKINNIYRVINAHENNSNLVTINDGYKYCVKITDAQTNKDIYNVNFWVIKIGDEWSVCTVYEYDRSIDRCAATNIY